MASHPSSRPSEPHRPPACSSTSPTSEWRRGWLPSFSWRRAGCTASVQRSLYSIERVQPDYHAHIFFLPHVHRCSIVRHSWQSAVSCMPRLRPEQRIESTLYGSFSHGCACWLGTATALTSIFPLGLACCISLGPGCCRCDWQPARDPPGAASLLARGCRRAARPVAGGRRSGSQPGRLAAQAPGALLTGRPPPNELPVAFIWARPRRPSVLRRARGGRAGGANAGLTPPRGGSHKVRPEYAPQASWSAPASRSTQI